MRNLVLSLLCGLVAVAAAVPASAQGFGEQGTLQFKYVNQGMQTEIYRQFKASATAAAAQALGAAGGAGGASGADGQGNTAMSDVVQLGTTYLNVTNTGNGAVLNIDGVKVGQSSSGTNQSNGNSRSAVLNQ